METGARSFAFWGSVDEDVLLLGRQVFEGGLEVDLVALGGEVDELEEVLRGRAGAEAAVEQRLGPVVDDFGGVEVVERAEAVALGAGAEGGVKGEAARFELGDVEAAIGAGHGRGEELLFGLFGAGGGGQRNDHEAVGELKGLADGGVETFFEGRLCGRGFELSHPFRRRTRKGWGTHICIGWGTGRWRRGRTRVLGGLQQDPVDDGFDGVVLALIEGRGLGHVDQLAVDAGAEALLVELVEQILELAFAAADNGGHDRDALAGAHLENSLDDLF